VGKAMAVDRRARDIASGDLGYLALVPLGRR
jgi:hypothetical protein